MKEEVTNKTLVYFLLIAIVVSVVGLLFRFGGEGTLTGLAGTNTSGVAKVNITESVSITLLQATVDFGNGFRNQSNIISTSNCNLSTDDAAVTPACWTNSTGYNPMDFQLTNDGNVYVNVTINSSLPATFIPGPYTGGGIANYTWIGQAQTGGTDEGCSAPRLTTTETQFTNADQLLCTNFTSDDATDNMNISVKVYIPAGPTGNKSVSVNFIAAKNY